VPPQYPIWLVKNKDKIKADFEGGQCRKKQRGVKHAPLNEQLHRGFLDKRAKNLPITGPFYNKKHMR